MGTPEFATTILKAIHESVHEVAAVITVPDKPSGRGQKVHESHVKQYATSENLLVLQPPKLKDPSFLEELKKINADLFVVVAFRMLPEEVWSMPPKGTINLHASLLPQYRGAAPINWAIINGETETGVSTFFIEKEIDTGKVIQQAKVSIGLNENVGELYHRLMDLGAEVVIDTLNNIAGNNISPKDQNDFDPENLKPAPKIFKEDCIIDFNKTSKEVHDFVRGLSPYPAAWCILENEDDGSKRNFKIHQTKIPSDNYRIGRISVTKEGILFPTNDGHILIEELQPEGKRRMNFKEFIAGNDLSNFKISC